MVDETQGPTGPVDPDSFPVDAEGRVVPGYPDRGDHAPSREQPPFDEDSAEGKFAHWFTGLPESVQKTIEDGNIGDDLLNFYRLIYAESPEDLGGLDPDEIRQNAYDKLKDNPTLQRALGHPEGGEDGPSWWEIIEEKQREAELEAERDTSEDPELTDDEIAANEARAKEIQRALKSAVDDPNSKEKQEAAEEAMKHLREHDGEFAKKLQKGSPWYYKMLTALAITFYIYVALQTAAASAAPAFFNDGKK